MAAKTEKIEELIYRQLISLPVGLRYKLKTRTGLIVATPAADDHYIWLTCDEGIKPTSFEEAARFIAGTITWNELEPR